MISDDIDQLLKNLHMAAMREVVERELARAQKTKPSYADFYARVLREQYKLLRERSLEYRIRRARLPERWTLETFPFDLQPAAPAAVVRQLAELDYVVKKENIVFVGPTGVGKTGLASALLLKALENSYRGLFVKAQDLFDEMYASLADRSSRKLLNRLMSVDVLLIDEMGYLNLRPEQTNLFFKLMEERYRSRGPGCRTPGRRRTRPSRTAAGGRRPRPQPVRRMSRRAAAPGGTTWSVPGGGARSGPGRRTAPAGAAGRWLAREAPEGRCGMTCAQEPGRRCERREDQTTRVERRERVERSGWSRWHTMEMQDNEA
jgi:DNA replication protein DnaC